mgnify:FL=1
MIKYLLAILCLTFFSCGENKQTPEIQSNKEPVGKINEDESNNNNFEFENNNENHKLFSLGDYFTHNDTLGKIVDNIFNRMNDGDKVAQMIITSTGNYGKSPDHIINLIKNRKIGGVVFLGGSIDKFRGLIKDFTNTARKNNSLPLIFSTDAEPSLINIKISGLESFRPTNTIKTLSQSKQTAMEISEILKSIGFQQNFAPVCDNNINREIIGNRSFGSNLEDIEQLASRFIEETQSENIIATAKHFPGHGNVKGDSHKSLVYIDGELKELDVYENLIQNKNLLAIPISIMVGHIAIRNNKDGFDTDNYPATLSRKIVTVLLKQQMNYTGIVITDGMNMGALNSFSRPSFLAVKAGCDMILMPSDEEQLYTSILTEYKENKEFQDQINESVKKIIRAKVCLGMM